MSSVSIAEYRKLFPIKKNKKRRSAKQVARQPSVGEMVLATHLRACKIGFEQEYKFHPVWGMIALGGFFFVCGLPGWALVRWIFNFIDKQEGKTIVEVIKEFKKARKDIENS
ncbi:hypothetical protein [Acinetobacter baumannii]|uniref:hypothetical protein n=1 Tax=Acinetobacter baumannii TaxID=470 RepID=UPI000ADCDB16|nr:hypothetical protein [Acinetobacter baumannii]